MSRPFSYNDENFTVIGNLLFCHIKIDYNTVKNDIVEVPAAIYKRLTSFSNVFFTSVSALNSRTASSISLGIRLVNNIPFIYTTATIDWRQVNCLYSIYALTDI